MAPSANIQGSIARATQHHWRSEKLREGSLRGLRVEIREPEARSQGSGERVEQHVLARRPRARGPVEARKQIAGSVETVVRGSVETAWRMRGDCLETVWEERENNVETV